MHTKSQKYFTAKGYFFNRKVVRRFSQRTLRKAKGFKSFGKAEKVIRAKAQRCKDLAKR